MKRIYVDSSIPSIWNTIFDQAANPQLVDKAAARMHLPTVEVLRVTLERMMSTDTATENQ